jgi:acetyl-CoA acetyltransferase
MSEQMIKSICKSAAYGETAEKTAEMHGCTTEDVKAIWAEMPEKIAEYKQFLAEMGAI